MSEPRGFFAALRHPITWIKDRKDPFRNLQPYELELPGRVEEEGDEVNTELRDYLIEVAEADARGGLDEVIATIEKRWIRHRDDIRFAREGTMLAIAKAALGISALGLLISFVALVIAIRSGGGAN